VSVHSEPEGGTRFTLTLPLAEDTGPGSDRTMTVRAAS
jgi:signal transduction histidine kinase